LRWSKIFGHANAALEVDRELEFGDLIEGDLSRAFAVQGGVSGFAGFAGDIGAVLTRQDVSTILQCGP
jgi:hypothetical protein